MSDVAAGPNIVIASQGGGSHSAFGAGVLGTLLCAPELDGHRITGLSGTSGGAINAILAWTALRDGDRASARQRLDSFWADNAANGPIQALLNAAVVGASVLQNLDALPGVSPYLVPEIAAGQFRSLLERHVDFDAITADPDHLDPLLVLGAVDVLSGDFRAFSSYRERITADTVAASAAIPNLFRAVETAGGTFWDGLFSQNPPVRDLLAALPDELWVVQITPSTVDRLPRTLTEIADRRGELAGNLSLHQELDFVETLNVLIDAGRLAPGGSIGRTTIRIIELPRAVLPRALGSASKADRSPAFIASLVEAGRTQAQRFLGALEFERAWHAGDTDALTAAAVPGAPLLVGDPFPAGERAGVAGLVERGIRPDSARRQVAGDTVRWTVPAPDGQQRCLARARFEGRLVSELRVGSPAD